MPFEDVMANMQRMLLATEALAAIGAELTLKQPGQESGDPGVQAALGAVSAAAGIDLDSLAPPQQAMILGMIRLYFAQADDLLREPGRAPGWTYTDPLVLDGMGRGSMMIPQLLAAQPEFGSVDSLLDVGAGVGLLALSAANVWPSATVVGIDVWEPALERARANVKNADLDDRITLRNQNVTDLDDVDAYDCAWLPTFFLDEEAMPPAVSSVKRALRTHGWIVLGLFASPPDPVAQAATKLRTIRGGGSDLDPKRASDLLRKAGYESVRTIEPNGPAPIVFVIGRKSPTG
jgi:SAM-dependent methyltransferase